MLERRHEGGGDQYASDKARGIALAKPVDRYLSVWKIRKTAFMLDALPRANALLGDRGYGADWFHAALAERKVTACISSKKKRKMPIPHDTALHRQRHKIEIMFGRLKDWAPYPHPPRSLRSYLHVRHLRPRNRHLLA